MLWLVLSIFAAYSVVVIYKFPDLVIDFSYLNFQIFFNDLPHFIYA